MGGGGQNRFVGGGIDNPISVDDMNGNMGNLRMSQGAGGGGGVNQGAGGAINSAFGRSGNGGGGGVGGIRGGGGGGGRSGMFMGIELYFLVSVSFQSLLT